MLYGIRQMTPIDPAGAGPCSQLSGNTVGRIYWPFGDVWVNIRPVLLLYLCFLQINIELSSKTLVRCQGYGEEKEEPQIFHLLGPLLDCNQLH